MNTIIENGRSRLICSLGMLLLLSPLAAHANCDPLNCNPEPWTSRDRQITLLAFPTCPITMHYDERKCDNASATELKVTGFSFLPNSGSNCLDFFNFIIAANGSPEFESMDAVLRSMTRELASDLFTEFYDDLETHEKTIFDCATGSGLRQYNAYFTECVAYSVCWSGEGPWSLEVVDCGNLFCCQMAMQFCWDSNIGAPRQSTTYYSTEPSCGSPALTFVNGCMQFGCLPFCAGTDIEVQRSSAPLMNSTPQSDALVIQSVSPNPVAKFDEIRVQYSIVRDITLPVTFRIFDVFGRELFVQFHLPNNVGNHEITVPNSSLFATGVYLLQLETESNVLTTNMRVVK